MPRALVPAWSPTELAELLRLQLAAPLEDPPARPDTSARPTTYGQLLLLDRAPPADLLRRVKDWAKSQMGGGSDTADLPREVAGVIYFAAVAAARLRGRGGDGGPAVSTLADGPFRKGAAWARQLPWLDPRLRVLFGDAVATLDQGLPEAGAVPGTDA